MSKIINIKAREILDSRGNPTVEVEVTTEKGIKAVGIILGIAFLFALNNSNSRWNKIELSHFV